MVKKYYMYACNICVFVRYVALKGAKCGHGTNIYGFFLVTQGIIPFICQSSKTSEWMWTCVYSYLPELYQPKIFYNKILNVDKLKKKQMKDTIKNEERWDTRHIWDTCSPNDYWNVKEEQRNITQNTRSPDYVHVAKIWSWLYGWCINN